MSIAEVAEGPGTHPTEVEESDTDNDERSRTPESSLTVLEFVFEIAVGEVSDKANACPRCFNSSVRTMEGDKDEEPETVGLDPELLLERFRSWDDSELFRTDAILPDGMDEEPKIA